MRKIFKRVAGWSSSKKAMWFAATVVLLYAAAVLFMNNAGRSADAELTNNIIEFCKWFAGFSATVGTVKIVKGKGSECDSDECETDEKEEDEE